MKRVPVRNAGGDQRIQRQNFKKGGSPKIMKRVYYVVRPGVDRVTPYAILVKTRNTATAMSGNPTFPNPVPALPGVITACNDLEAAIAAYDLNPGPRERSERAQAFDVVKGMYLDLCAYVQAVSNGALSIIESAGCEVKRSSTPVGQLPPPAHLLSHTTVFPGRIDIRWGGVSGRSGYNVFICTSDPEVPANWSHLVFTTRNHYSATGLNTDKVYYFRVNAIGAAGASGMSDLAFAKAA